MIRCLHCDAETSNGLGMCELCRRLAESIFEMLPVYFTNLSRQRRPGRPNGSLGTSSTWLIRRGETEGSKVLAALERASNDIDQYVRWLTDDLDVRPKVSETEAETFTAMCAFLETNLTSIATQTWAGQLLADLTRHEKALRELTESVVPGWYAGMCRQVTGRDMEGNVYTCGVDTFVVPGLTWVTCSGCGVTTYARDHLEVIRVEARPWTASPKRLADAVVALVDTELSSARLNERIKKWATRGHIEPVRRLDEDGDPIGPKHYRFGDVLDRLEGEGPTRLEKTLPRGIDVSACAGSD